jgi:hypothetical protein
MILRLAGVNHKDPAMRQSLINWMAQWASAHGVPCFIAVEWDELAFDVVKAKRQEFRTLLKQQWPEISEDLLNTLTLSLGYEGDSHDEIYSGVDILWLDEGRKEGKATEDMSPGYLDKCAHWRLRDYKSFLGPWPSGASDSEILLKISHGASKVTPFQPGSRDEEWVKRIMHKAKQTVDCQWALIVVGEGHTRKVKGSMRCGLEQLNFVCEVVSVTSAPASQQT